MIVDWRKATYTDYPSADNFPQTGDDPATVEYKEDIFVGYRHFDKANIQPLYPFGYGLSYTTFSYSKMTIKANGENILVSLTIKNTGKQAGKESVQLYVATPNSSLKKELKAFAKTRLLQPGKSQTITMTVQRQELTGVTNTFLIGASSRDIKLQFEYQITQ